MKVLLTGGTGFIGSAIITRLLEQGDRCVVISRGDRNPWSTDRVEVVQADPTRAGAWQEQVGQADVVINLAGAPMVDPRHRWTTERRETLRASRVETTRRLVEAMERFGGPKTFVSGSAVGYYGSRDDEKLDEGAGPGDGFLADLAIEWEQAARAADAIARVVIVRTGIVLGLEGGALPSLRLPFLFGVGGPWGSGEQYWPWIHRDDAVGLILWAIDGTVSGAINLAAPQSATVKEFARALGKALRRPSFIPLPGLFLKLTLGEASETLLASQRVLPRRALDEGYTFRHPELDPALRDLVR